MSTLTKFFVVLLVVFSIALTMSAISFVVQSNDWKGLADKYREDAKVVEAQMRNLSASHAAEKATWLDVSNALNDKIAALELESQRLARDVSKLSADLAAANMEKSSAEALSRTLTGELQIAQKGWQTESEKREAMEQRKLDLERRNQDLDTRVSEQANQLIAMEQEKRQLEQQIHILKTENRRLARLGKQPPTILGEAGGGVARGRVLPLTETTGSPIRGRITEVNGPRASISVGSADGVEVGMVFVIFRGSDYVGDVEITDVEPNLAAGRITHTVAAPRTGDLVADEALFGVAE